MTHGMANMEREWTVDDARQWVAQHEKAREFGGRLRTSDMDVYPHVKMLLAERDALVRLVLAMEKARLRREEAQETLDEYSIQAYEKAADELKAALEVLSTYLLEEIEDGS